jgi:hypothetical protein
MPHLAGAVIAAHTFIESVYSIRSFALHPRPSATASCGKCPGRCG